MSQRIEERKKKARLVKAKRRLERQDELDRRKHWGVETRINEYRDTIVDNIDFSELEDVLDQFNEENIVTEDLFDNIASQINFSNLIKAETVDELQRIVAEMFERGSTRVLTVDGESLSVSFDEKPRRLVNQLEQQEIFLKNLQEDAEEKVRDIIIRGSEEGKSIGEMQDEIMEGVESMTKHRAETTARSELVNASNEGTKAAMDEAGIEEGMIDASIDSQTCEPGSFSTRVNGETVTSCREWDGEVVERSEMPNIPRDSHPQCRCALLIITPED